MATPHFNPKPIKKFLSRLVPFLLLAALACNTISNLPAALQPTATSTNTPIPTNTPTPTPTFTPTPVTTGSLKGKLVEGVLSDDTASRPRPPLANVLVLLCADYSTDASCTTSATLATYTDADGAFYFEGLEPGKYGVLYNPFKIEDGPGYLDHFEGREILLGDVSGFAGSVCDDETSISISGGPNAGVSVTFDQAGNLILGAPTADTAIYTSDFTVVAEYIEDGVPATVNIKLGQTADLTLKIHATLQIGDSIFLEPAGEPIDLPDSHGVKPPESANGRPTSTDEPVQAAPTESANLLVIEDPFDDNRNNWVLTNETADWGTVTSEMKNGLLRTGGTMTQSMYYNFFVGMEPVADSEISVDVWNVSGIPDTTYGLVFYAEDDYRNITFAISDSGTFTVMSYFDDYNIYALDEPSDAIIPGGFNTLTVKSRGSHLTFSINHEQVYEVDASDLPSDGIAGVYVDWSPDPALEQVVDFDNFVVMVP